MHIVKYHTAQVCIAQGFTVILNIREPPWGLLHNGWKIMFCYSANTWLQNYNDGNQNLSEFSLVNSHFSGYSEKTFKTDLPKGGKQ